MGVGIDSIGGALALYGTGLVTGLLLMRGQRGPRKPPGGPESPEESLRRLGASTVPQKGGQRLMGPQQPRPRVQDRIPSAPPRGGYRATGTPVSEMPRVPAGMPTRGTSDGAGQARGL